MYGRKATLLLFLIAMTVVITLIIPDAEMVETINPLLVLMLTIYTVFIIIPAYTGIFEDEPLGDLLRRTVSVLGIIGVVLVAVKVEPAENTPDMTAVNILIAVMFAYLGVCVIKYVIAMRKRKKAKDAEAAV